MKPRGLPIEEDRPNLRHCDKPQGGMQGPRMPMKDKVTDKGLSLAANIDNARFDGRQDYWPIKRFRVLHVRAPRIANEKTAEAEDSGVRDENSRTAYVLARRSSKRKHWRELRDVTSKIPL